MTQLSATWFIQLLPATLLCFYCLRAIVAEDSLSGFFVQSLFLKTFSIFPQPNYSPTLCKHSNIENIWCFARAGLESSAIKGKD
ncbi:MAG TPA: hypothetical protein VE978_09130 [Chitinophagales bacterium]|nr:hypothetical protein [Chitinophagales bacterium]